ncbi:MAG TPA: hypothetical protein VIF09_12665 [Polyangiaceae bacterium]
MSDPPRVPHVTLAERVVTTALVPVLVLLADRIPLAGVDPGPVAKTGVHVSLMAMGLAPFITAYALVELVALVVPRFRPARHSTTGRARLERASVALALVFAVVQGFGISMSLESIGPGVESGWGQRAVVTASLAGGSCAAAIAARWATRRGLLNGYVLWWTLPTLLGLLRGDAFRAAIMRDGGRGAALFTVALLVPVAATLVAVWGADDLPGRPSKLRFPVPVSSIQPYAFAGALLMFPATLAAFHLPGMRDLQALLQRNDVVFDVADVGLILFAMLVATALLYVPREVTAFLRQMGGTADAGTRGEVDATLRRALLPTAAYLLVLFAASMAIHGQSPSAPAVVVVALGTAAVVDLVGSLRAHVRTRDLVLVTTVHEAYEVPSLRAALAGEGIQATSRGTGVLSLLQAWGPYAPAELYVPAAQAERAASLLGKWGAEGPGPASPDAAGAKNEAAGLSPRTRATVLAVLGAIAIAVVAMPAPAPPPDLPRADIAIVRVDDVVNPLRDVRADETPDGVSIYSENVPGPDRTTRNRAYARVVAQHGESLDHAWTRVLPWLSRYTLPEGDRWAGEEVLEADESSGNDGEPVAWKAVAIRSLIIERAAIVTTADVLDAHAMVGDELLGNASVTVTLSEPGAARFADATGAWVGQRLAIVVNGRVSSAPVVRSRIGGGKVSISMGAGDRDKQLEDARRLAASLGER